MEVAALGALVQRAREHVLLGEYERGEELLGDAVGTVQAQVRKGEEGGFLRNAGQDGDGARDELPEERQDRHTIENRKAVDKWKKTLKALRKERDLARQVRETLQGRRATPRDSRSSKNHRADDDDADVPIWKQQQHQQQPPPQRGTPSSGGRRMTPSSKPRVPRQPTSSSSSSSARRQNSSSNNNKGGSSAQRRGRASGRRDGAAESKASSYVEHMEGSPDIDLIKQIESTMLTKSLNVNSEDIAGLQGAKQVLEEAVLYPQLMPQYYTGIRRPWKGVLLFGPPGTGKTMLAKSIASECRTCFFNVASAALTSKWRGESEKMVGILFDMARFYAPSTIFFDEIDSIASARGGSTEHEASRRVKSELLTQMDGVSGDGDESGSAKTVVVLAATNLPWDLDDAIRRRLEKRIYIPLPDHDGRAELFKIATREVRLCDDVDFEKLADESDGYSGADITNVCHEASMMPIRRIIEETKQEVHAQGGGRHEVLARMKQLGQDEPSSPPVGQQDLLMALTKVQSSVGGRDLSKYQAWLEEYGAT
ncbi:Katanin p60 ATPase-containing subunit A1 (Katanin p60 subunit A1) (p60 katanin) [Durusdinium trenchii]|uniref:Katanin p60 ATPase-containing subunit A1 n=1 Tax=Durusdinium trenchii TaxID=1381693 RepID=A0ABP0IGB8_9DINO